MRFLALTFAAFWIGACSLAPAPSQTSPTAAPPYRISPEDNPHTPQLEDVNREVAATTITSADLAELYDESPPRVALSVVGYMPSVCNELRVEVSPPDANFNIFVQTYSLINPAVQCDNVFQQFDATILLGTYSRGRYTLWLNNMRVGDFVSN
ncbi:MAG: hypothetical protein LC099_04380 [Anaerolineales bacterium]|nr:hypothetical protein [Anaerolineales bacterium]